MKPELQNLAPLRMKYDDFHDFYQKWMKSATVEEFEEGWKTLLQGLTSMKPVGWERCTTFDTIGRNHI